MPESVLKALLEKYFNGTATAAEISALEKLTAQSVHHDELNAALKELWDGFIPDEGILPEKANELFAGIVIPMRKRIWWPAAAIITILLMAGGAKFLFRPSTSSTETIVFKNDILPGGNHAILTLADGKQITLDSAGNGTLGKQGNTIILKPDSGQLTYQQNGTTPQQSSYNKITTPRGGQFQVVLADGTKVWMNAASTMRFPTAFIGTDRQVELSGEAYFEVAQDPAKPFIVNVNRMKVAVLGTAFNVMSYADEKNIQTTLIEGAVNVSANGNSTQLHPGEQIQLTTDGKMLLVTDPDIESTLAWKNGYLQFNKADLQSVMRQLARWYDIDVVYKDQVPDFMFVGQLDKSANLSVILKILERSQVHFNVEGRTITVMP
jgi:ferric-dicitrate binding protein FerR (iron transport regulator)